MKSLTGIQSNIREFNQYQNMMSQALDPIVRNPLNYGSFLKSVSLAVGTTIIPHGLTRDLQGWIIVRKRAASDIWDSQDLNKTPSQTLVLNASAAVVVDIFVY